MATFSAGAVLLLALLALTVAIATFEGLPIAAAAYSQRFAQNVQDIDFVRDPRTIALLADYPRRMAEPVVSAKQDIEVSPFLTAMLHAWQNNVIARTCRGASAWLDTNMLALAAIAFVALAVVGPQLRALLWGSPTAQAPITNMYVKPHKHNVDELSRLFEPKKQ